MELPELVRQNIVSPIYDRCQNFETDKVNILIKRRLMITVYGYKSSRNVCKDYKFLTKLFHSKREELREYLWEDIWGIQANVDWNSEIVQNLYSISSMELFTSSLMFTGTD
ncbi:unnamed protein product, partial [Allacma fusca]